MAINNTISAASAAASSSDRRQWQRIFGVLVGILQKQESQIETLIDDRKFLEDYVQFQHDSWVSKTCLLHSQVAQIKEEEEIQRRAHEAKSDLLIGLKEKELECHREHLDLLKSDLEDLYGCMESLSQQNRQLKKRFEPDKESKEDDSLTGEGSGRKSEHVSFLEGKLRKLKLEFKVLSSKKEEEISSLLAEKDFIWNQYKKIDEDYTSLRRMKHIELEQANEATKKLQSIIVNLQSAVTEKDDTIASLRVAVSELELELGKKIEEVELSNESQIKSRTELDKLRAMLIEKDETISRVAHEQIDEQANEATEKLQSIIYNLQSAVTEKDDTIASLRVAVSELELELGKKIKEVELSNESQIKSRTELDKLRAMLIEKDETISRVAHEQIDEQANEATEKLQSIIYNLQSVLAEKDDNISSLKAAISELELDLGKKIQEVELSNESQIKSQTELDKLRVMLIEKDETISRVAHEQIDEQANEATEKLQSVIYNLQSVVTEKDDTISSLRDTISELELDLGKKIQEVELSNESQIKSQTELDKLRVMLIEKDETISRVAHEQIDEQANEATEKLQSVIYNLQSVVAEKDDTISSLRDTISELEVDLGKKIKEEELSNERQMKFQAELDKLRSMLNERDETIPKSVDDQVKHAINSRKATKCVSKHSERSGPPRLKEGTVSSEKCRLLRSNSRQRSMDTRLKGMNICDMPTRSCSAGKTNGLEPRLTSRKRSSLSQESSMLFSANFKVPKMKDLASPLS